MSKVKKPEQFCSICNSKIPCNVKQTICTLCRTFFKYGYLETEILRKVQEQKEINDRTLKFSSIIVEINPTYHKFWLERGYSVEESNYKIKTKKKSCIEYWIDRGYSNEDAILIVNKHITDKVKENKEYWLNRNYSIEDAEKEVIKQKKWRSEFSTNKFEKSNNVLRKEHWLNLGYNETEAIEQIKLQQYNRFKHLSKDDYSKASIKASITLRKDKNKFEETKNKLSIANKKNIYVSPVFKEYWIKQGYSIEEARKKVLDTKYISRDGTSLSSKVEVKCLDELGKYLNLKLEYSKFRYIDNQYFCFDAKYNNFIIEFNGTNPHLDERFHNESSQTPWGESFSFKKEKDNNKINKTLSKYNVIIIWEYDYLNNKDKVFNEIKKFINNETSKKGKYWDSTSI